MELKDPF